MERAANKATMESVDVFFFRITVSSSCLVWPVFLNPVMTGLFHMGQCVRKERLKECVNLMVR